MIPLTKGPRPDILQKNARRWTNDLIQAINSGEKLSSARKGRYNHPDVKQALINETRDKCAYCESKISHITYGDIEHITPKDSNPQLAYEWDNLTLACDVCNTQKSNHIGLVDPYKDAVDRLFKFLGPMMCAVPGEDKASVTLLLLKLNRPQLIERRWEKLTDLLRQIEVIKKTTDSMARKLFLQALLNQAGDVSVEYAACSRSFVEAWRVDGVIPIEGN